MKFLIIFILISLGFSDGLLAKKTEPVAKGNAIITVGEDAASWPVWNCKRVVLAHKLPYDDILVDQHIKLIDYGDVIQMVLKLKGKNYLADIPAKVTVNSVDYTGAATRINPVTMANDGEVQFTLKLQCNP